MTPSPAATPPPFTIHPACPADIPAVRTLFIAYAAWLDLDLAFQSFDAELASLPGAYAPSHGGRLLLARAPRGETLGCVALRRLRPGEAELKRLFVLETGRGSGVGRALVQAALRGAAEEDYAVVRLDSLPRMEGARRLYASLGFRECGRYYETPLEGTTFWEYRLKREA